MSHRTEDLPTLSGVGRAIRELRYNEIARQSLAVVLILFYALTARGGTYLVAIGMPLALLGESIRLYASGFIVKNKELADNGPYALVRHPLYTGNILIIIGFSASNGGWWSIPLALLFFWFYYPTAIEYEDRKLRRLFGEQWERWAEYVPALLPAVANVGKMSGGKWSLAKSARRNGEIYIAIYILLCMGLVIWQLD